MGRSGFHGGGGAPSGMVGGLAVLVGFGFGMVFGWRGDRSLEREGREGAVLIVVAALRPNEGSGGGAVAIEMGNYGAKVFFENQ